MTPLTIVLTRTLLTVVLTVSLVVGVGIGLTLALCLGRERFRASISNADRKLVAAAPYLGGAVLFFLLKQATNDLSLQLSYALDWNITDSLYAFEGLFVATLQNAVPEPTYWFFSAMYMFGFSYLLLVAPVLYFLLPSLRHFKALLVAYVLNYAVGAVCYTLFIAYGPRNWIPSHVDGTMYRLYPETQELTAAVASGTNVFPSLHTSLSVIVLLFAWRTRRAYPRWFYIAAGVASSVVLSTMVLGIHWFSDVLAGVVLGTWCVLAASRLTARLEDGTDLTSTVDDSGTARSDLGD